MKSGFSSPPYFHNSIVAFCALSACLIYGTLAYFTIRTEFLQLITLVGFAFVCTYILVEKSRFKFKQLLVLGIIYRLIFIVATPNLSQDFFRFFWDGQLVLQGINPYLETVDYFFSNGLQHQIYQADILREGMGSLNASHYSNYPPVSQWIYAIAAWFAKDSIMGFIVALRIILIGFDLLFVAFAKKLLIYFNKDPKQLFWYILNPLCLLEITGNLHLEGVMISLFIAGFYLLLMNRKILSALLISLSISTKLISLIFIPILIKYIYKTFKFPQNLNLIWSYGFWFVFFLMIPFALFYSPAFISNFSDSIGLWFAKFEFNASLFYLVRYMGYKVVGWNIIQTYALVMPMLSVLCFLVILYRKKISPISMLESFMWMLTIYYLLSTTVHPWYVLFPLAISVFTKYQYVYLWSCLVFLSYHAYKVETVKESYGILFLEYGLVLVVLFYELNKTKLNRYFEFFRLKRTPK